VDLTSYGPTLSELDRLSADDRDNTSVLRYITDKMDHLQTSRPTAVNLQNALTELKGRLLQTQRSNSSADGDGGGGADGDATQGDYRAALVQQVVEYATFMYERDTKDNQQIGAHGALAILDKLPSTDDKVTLMTICNTGSLATSHYGTALGVVRAIREAGRLQQIVALETRPYNQGSRLTAYEMVAERMPSATLICDSMAAAFMKQRPVHACVVGADRVCANGDTANKIGTYMLAIVAQAHGVPFYVAAPLTTLDVNLSDGDDIPIEQRPAKELLETSNAPEGVGVWNPAFDVTPAGYITGIVTEKGVIYPNADGAFDCAAFVKQHRS